MKLKFNGKTIEVKTHPEDPTLYCLNDLKLMYETGSGADTTKFKPSHFLRNKKNKGCKNVRLTLMRGTRQVIETYTDEKTVYKYAAWIDDDFYDAVFECFKAAANGEANVAVDIATSVAIPDGLLQREKHLHCEMNKVIGQKMPWDKHAQTNFNRLISKCICGFTPAQLTDKSMSAFQWAVKQNHVSGVGAYLAAMETVIRLVRAGLDYQTIALALGVETNKNKTLLRIV